MTHEGRVTVHASGAIQKLAFVGNHLPRRCGIATFTSDLSAAVGVSAPSIECMVVAMNDPGASHDYPQNVRFEIAEGEVAAYRRAAQFINANGVDVVSLQHEYGIFGGQAGNHVITLLRELRVPVVTTLHTILTAPNAEQRRTLDEILALSERIVVMSAHGRDTLCEQHAPARDRIDLIPHGIPAAAPRAFGKDRLGFTDQNVLLTFGLLSPDKGIEYVIDALPAILREHPDTVFVVVGATHPHVRERHGEAYRLSLISRARRLGVYGNVSFHDRFVSDGELADFLAVADVYVTPYLNLEQSTSGTLARAVAAGRAVVSTPYWHARELLSDGRGVLVPARDSEALGKAISELLTDDAKRAALGEMAAAQGRSMVWPVVAGLYLESFQAARQDQVRARRDRMRAQPPNLAPDLPELNLDHLRTMTDQTGLLQHATFAVPRYSEGYCLDDNARALLLMALLENSGVMEAKAVRELGTRYLAFVAHAFDPSSQLFRNFMGYSRNWLEKSGSEDSHGHAVWALGATIGRASDPGRSSLSGELFRAALPALASFTSPRTWAYGLLGIDEYLKAFQGDSGVEAVRRDLVARLVDLHQRASSSDWDWFETSLTYSNARLSQALIVSGNAMGARAAVDIGLQTLTWLAATQTSPDLRFAPVGSNGFYPRGGKRAAFDQQPVEAAAMVSASLEALRVSRNPVWAEHACRAFDWFLGHNHLEEPLYDATTGGCRDGLHEDRLNQNQGAESTLSFLLALVEMRSADYAQIPQQHTTEGTMTLDHKRATLFRRHGKNPLLSAADWPYPVHTVFNAGATRLADGTTLLLCRVEDHRGISHLCAARSANGVDGWQIDKTPTLMPDPENHPEEHWGIEDPRITFLQELGKYAIAYTAFTKSGPGVALALTEDFRTFERLGLVMQPDDKDAALLPRRIDGSFALIHRPMSDTGAHIWISYSPDLKNWGSHKLVLAARRGGFWDANKVGLSPPLVETSRGWLMFYHGVRQTASGSLYRLGVALLDRDNPHVCLARGDSWLFGPETAYEREGDVGNVVFPCGYTVAADGDTLNFYYGAADTVIALAQGSIKEILSWLDEHGTLDTSSVVPSRSVAPPAPTIA